jgi:hypothetical protein
VSDAFYQFANEHERGSQVVAITGMPGIGKSWTLLYALQQALLYDGANVLFFFQKSDDVFLYLRRNNKIYAWNSTPKSNANSDLFKRLDVLVLLDPKEAKQGGADFALGKMKLLYAASNNDSHFTDAAGKNNADLLGFLGPPLDNELPVIVKRLDKSLTDNVIAERQANVGNLIRYILTEKSCKSRKDAIDLAVKSCIRDPNTLEDALDVNGMSNAQKTISGTLFKVLPKRPVDLDTIGYDGQGIKYRGRVVEAANSKVRGEILKAKRTTIISYLGKTSNAEFSKMGDKAEEMFIKDLTNPDGMVVKTFLQARRNRRGEERTLVVENSMDVQREKNLSAICAEVLVHRNVVAKAAKNTALIDAAGPGLKVYQVTISPGHTMSLEAMESLSRYLGYILDDKVVQSEVEKLEFYWVVPIGIASQWQNKAPRKYNILEKDSEEISARKTLVNEVLATHVDQYVLPMTYEPPITYAESLEGAQPR